MLMYAGEYMALPLTDTYQLDLQRAQSYAGLRSLVLAHILAQSAWYIHKA